MYPVVEEHVRRAMGSTLFESFMVRSFPVLLFHTHVFFDVLLGHSINISKG